MTAITVTGGPQQVSSILSTLVNRLTPRAPKAVISPDTVAYQQEDLQVKPDEHLLELSTLSDGRMCIKQGMAEAKRIILLLPYTLTYSEAEDILAALISTRADGFTFGYDDGFSSGWTSGYRTGEKHGHQKGRDEALSEIDR